MNARIATLPLAALMIAAPLANAAEKSNPAAPAEKSAPAAKSAALAGGLGMAGLPAWTPPGQYSVDLVMTHEGQSMTMKRFIDGGRTRSEMTTEGRQIVMLERPEDNGAIYNLMPSEKMAMKMTPSKMAEHVPNSEDKAEKAEKPEDVKIEKVGAEPLDGRAALKYRMTSQGHSALGWFDESTGAPIRMEAEGAVIEWKNYKPGPVAAKMFEVPKDYQVMDMDDMMKQMKSLRGGMGGPGGGGLPGGIPVGAGTSAAMRGMGGGMSGMAGNFGSQMGADMGQQFGAGVGTAFGGPLGGMVGGYIGGQVGGWLGRKTADAVTPGPPSR